MNREFREIFNKNPGLDPRRKSSPPAFPVVSPTAWDMNGNEIYRSARVVCTDGRGTRGGLRRGARYQIMQIVSEGRVQVGLCRYPWSARGVWPSWRFNLC